MLESQADCHAVLQETSGLVQAKVLDSSSQERLDFLLRTHFQDDPPGARYRSMICYGRDNLVVSIADFNNYIVLPFSSYAMELNSSTVIVPSIQFKRVSLTAQKELLHENTLSWGHASVNFILKYVVQHYYNRNQDICYFPVRRSLLFGRMASFLGRTIV
jgi:hypothetical protein